MLYLSFSFLKRMTLTVVFFLLTVACENDLKDIKALSEKKPNVETVTNVVNYYSQQAKMKAKLTSPIMHHYQTDSPYWEFPKSLHVDFYNDTLLIESQLNSRYGRFIENQRKVFLKDSVVVSNLKGDTLFCRELWWDQQKQIFYTDKPVRIHQPDKIIYGIGLEAPQDFSSFNTTEAHGFFRVPKGFTDQGQP